MRHLPQLQSGGEMTGRRGRDKGWRDTATLSFSLSQRPIATSLISSQQHCIQVEGGRSRCHSGLLHSSGAKSYFNINEMGDSKHPRHPPPVTHLIFLLKATPRGLIRQHFFSFASVFLFLKTWLNNEGGW